VNTEDLAFAGAARQAELLRRREVSSRELTEICLERIERLDPAINAFRAVMAEAALAEADEADRRIARGADDPPLLGVPVGIKDNHDVAGQLTTHGTAAHGPAATEDAEIVRRLRAAGAVVVGKTNLPELAIHGFTESETWGATRNPWNLERVPGGSSGGSAAAVAAGMVPLATASDGGGSIRIPAASCGIFGLKPQRGRVSMAPEREHWHGLSVAGCVSRTVLDTALFLDAVAGPGAGDADTPPPPGRPFVESASSPPGNLRIALSFKGALPSRLDPEMRAAIEATAELLRSLGHQVARDDVAFGTIGSAQATPRYLRGIHDDAVAMPHPEKLERRTRGIARLGALYRPWFIRWVRSREPVHARRLNRVLERSDVVLMPILTRPAFEVGRWEGRGAIRTVVPMSSTYPYAIPWNVTGQPACSVPAGFSRDGLPLAVQLVGRPNDEGALLSLAAQIEAERPWADRRPPEPVEP
jgi:amidase